MVNGSWSTIGHPPSTINHWPLAHSAAMGYNIWKRRTSAMSETLTISLDADLRQALLARSRACGQPLEAFVTRLLREAVWPEHPAPEPDPDEEIRNLPGVREFLQSYHPDPDEVLPCGMTLREYRNLSEEEEAALWDEDFRKELDKNDEPEIDVPPTVVTAQQRRDQAISARSGSSRIRKKADH